MPEIFDSNTGLPIEVDRIIKINGSIGGKQGIEEFTKIITNKLKETKDSINIDNMPIEELKNYTRELEKYKNKDGKIIQDWKNGKTHYEIYKEYGSFGLYLIFVELKNVGVEPKEFSEFLKILMKLD